MCEIDLHENVNAKVQKEDVLKRNARKKSRFKKSQNDPSNNYEYILEHKGSKLTVDHINSVEIEDREEIAQQVFEHFRGRGFPFPFYCDDELRKDYESLIAFDTNKLISDSNVVSSFSNHGSKIFKHFNHHFWNVKDKICGPTVIEVFNDDEKLKRVIRNRLGITFFYRGVSFPFDISGKMIIQGMRSMHLVPHTTNFRATVAKFIYDKHSKDGDIVYDYSSGFNQRLLGALASKNKIRYIGIDPLSDSIDAGNNIIDFLNIDTNRCSLIKSVSEEYCPSEFHSKVALAFSSPPYYDKEIYSEDSEQAYLRGYDSFIDDYWKRTVKNISTLLKEDGLFIVNICDEYKNDIESVILQNRFEKTCEYNMLFSKSHLSNKTNNKTKLKTEPLIVFKKL